MDAFLPLILNSWEVPSGSFSALKATFGGTGEHWSQLKQMLLLLYFFPRHKPKFKKQLTAEIKLNTYTWKTLSRKTHESLLTILPRCSCFFPLLYWILICPRASPQ